MPKAATSRTRIDRPAASSERVHLPKLGAIAVICFATGVGAVVWNAGGKPIPQHAPARAAAAEAPEDLAVSSDGEPEPSGSTGALVEEPTFIVAEGDAGAALTEAAVAPGAVDLGVPPATPFDGARRVEPGRVAYLRCDGLPQRPGPSPCPRDEALEAAVWAILATLPRCAEPPAGLGESDVRLELVPGAPTVVNLRAPRAGVPRLDGPAILGCVAGPLSHVASTLGATKMFVAFRFTLVDASAGAVRK